VTAGRNHHSRAGSEGTGREAVTHWRDLNVQESRGNEWSRRKARKATGDNARRKADKYHTNKTML